MFLMLVFGLGPVDSNVYLHILGTINSECERRSAPAVLQINGRSSTEHQLNHVEPLGLHCVHQRSHTPAVTGVRVCTSTQQQLRAPPSTYTAS